MSQKEQHIYLNVLYWPYVAEYGLDSVLSVHKLQQCSNELCLMQTARQTKNLWLGDTACVSGACKQ